MKDLQDVLKRINNIKRVTEALGESTEAIACFIESAMADAGVKSLLGGRLKINTIRSSAGNTTVLALDDGGDLTGATIGTGGYYYTGDYNAWVNYKTREDVIHFVDLIPEILKELASFGDAVDLADLRKAIINTEAK